MGRKVLSWLNTRIMRLSDFFFFFWSAWLANFRKRLHNQLGCKIFSLWHSLSKRVHFLWRRTQKRVDIRLYVFFSSRLQPNLFQWKKKQSHTTRRRIEKTQESGFADIDATPIIYYQSVYILWTVMGIELQALRNSWNNSHITFLSDFKM